MPHTAPASGLVRACQASFEMQYARDPTDVRIGRCEVFVRHLPMKWIAFGIISCLALSPAPGSESQVMNAAIERQARAIAPQAIVWRRDIHEHPELGYQEVRTAGLVSQH